MQRTTRILVLYAGTKACSQNSSNVRSEYYKQQLNFSKSYDKTNM